MLNGFIFSGTSNKDTIYGDWKDNHMPFNKIYNIQNYEKNSLLTYLNVKNTLQRLSKSEIQFIGVKILSLPLENLNVEKRVDFNIDALRILRTMVDEINFQSDNYILK